MLKPIILATMLAAGTPALATGHWYTVAASDLNNHVSGSSSSGGPATFSAPGATVSSVATPVPTITATVDSTCCGDVLGRSQFDYQFRVTGPGFVVVPMHARIVARGHAAAIINSEASSEYSMYIGGAFDSTVRMDSNVYLSGGFRGGAGTTGPSNFAVDQTVSFYEQANISSVVDGRASAYANSIGFFNDGTHYITGSSTASVYLDPYLWIDPTWSAAHPGYTLVVDSGFGNSPATSVPEPASWALMLGGFAIVGAAARRRRVFAAA